MTTAVMVDDLPLRIEGETVANEPDVQGALVRMVLLNDWQSESWVAVTLAAT
jgi:hypothetical protein